MKILKGIFTVFRVIVGIFCLLLCVAAVTLAIENKQPLFLLEILLFAPISFFALRGLKLSRRERKKVETVSPDTDVIPPLFTVTVTSESTVPDNVARSMRQSYTLMQAKRDAEIMAESFHLAATTANLETFCMRHDLAMRTAHTLLQAERARVRGIKKLRCHDACRRVIDASHALKVRALSRYEIDRLSKAEALKTVAGRRGRYIKMLMELEKEEPTFVGMDEYQALIARVKARISETDPKD